MKKLILLLIGMVILLFTIPIIFTGKFPEKPASSIAQQVTNTVEENVPYVYTQYGTVKLYHHVAGNVEELPIDTYLYGVVSAEMPASFELDALKAQAVVARTYTIYKIIHNGGKHEGADICDDSTCCQAWISKEDRLAKWEEATRDAYWNKIVEAVDSTQGKMITYEGEPINAFFHANSGGTTEAPFHVWGGTGYPYLQAVQTAGEEGYTQYASDASFTVEELTQKIQEKHSEFTMDITNPDCIAVEEYTEGGRVKTIRIGNVTLSGVEVRTLLGLRSANFTVQIEGNTIHFHVIGYGHGVGMSQTGADSLAKQGKNYEDIIKHFYTGVEIQDM